MSDGGTTRYSSEEETLLSWEVLLLNIAEGRTKLRYQDLLVFTTGASEISPGVFHDTLKLDFYTRSSERHYPTASTCDMRLIYLDQ